MRGVPLITVLFMASVMLPLFVPERFAPDKLVRALIGVALFASAYMAEVVRGGLAAVPRGQYEAASALGFGYWRMMALVILPQALRVTLPNIVNTFIGLFKDTTLVFVVGIFDFLRTVEAARADPKWAAPNTTRDRLCLRRALLLRLLLWHVALRAPMEARLRAPGGDEGRRWKSVPTSTGRLAAARRGGRSRRPEQMVRRVPRAARHQSEGRARRAHRHLRSVRRRQIDAASLHQPARGLAAAAASSSTASS